MRIPGRTRALGFAGLIAIAVSGLTAGGAFEMHLLAMLLGLMTFAISAAVAVVSGIYLLRRSQTAMVAAAPLAKVGFLSASLALLVICVRFMGETGSWWAWELPGAMILLIWLSYIAYFLIRSSTDAPDRAARFAAVFAIAAAVDAPFIYLSVRWFLSGRAEQVVAARGSILTPGSLTLLAGLCLSFLALMFYLYEAERARLGEGPRSGPLSPTKRVTG